MPVSDMIEVQDTGQTISKRELKTLLALVKTQGAELEERQNEIQQLRHKMQTQSRADRMEMPIEAKGIRQKVSMGGENIYLQFFEYDDGNLGEIWIGMTKEGTLAWGLANGLAKMISISLQHGLPITAIIRAFQDLEFFPNGATGDPEIKGAKSILDYLAKYLRKRYVNRTANKAAAKQEAQIKAVEEVIHSDAPEGMVYPECPSCHQKTLKPKAMGCNSVCSACGHIEAKGCGE